MHDISITGRRFLLDGEDFIFTGVSFFNAIYNKEFNRDSDARMGWMGKFTEYGINVLRIWGQWDNTLGFVDASPDSTLYYPDGRLCDEHVQRLRSILQDADRMGMVVQLALFSHESTRAGNALETQVASAAARRLAEELSDCRNLTFQIWNECDEAVAEHVAAIRSVDPRRLVTNSPGFAGVLGDKAHNELLDYLTPHTSRQNRGKPWEVAPPEIAGLLAEYDKPVVDDEPARNGTADFGGPREPTQPMDHILQMHEVWKLGGYSIYHHDMFQTGYGTPAIPPHGIPEPTFSPYHHEVFRFMKLKTRYRPLD